jgi:hypothetical protein
VGEAPPIGPDPAQQAVVAQPRAVMVPAQVGRIADPLLDAMVPPERAALRDETALRSAMAQRPAEIAERLRDETAHPSVTGGRLAKALRVGMVRLRVGMVRLRAPELRGMARRVAMVSPPVMVLRAATAVPRSAAERLLAAAPPCGPDGHRRVTTDAPLATRTPVLATTTRSSPKRSKRSSLTRSLGANSEPSARTMPIGWPATSSWRVD